MMDDTSLHEAEAEARRHYLLERVRGIRSAPYAASKTLAARKAEPTLLSFSQERLWFLEQMRPGTPLFNEAFLVTFRGRINASSLEAALQSVVSRQEALRTSFFEF